MSRRLRDLTSADVAARMTSHLPAEARAEVIVEAGEKLAGRRTEERHTMKRIVEEDEAEDEEDEEEDEEEESDDDGGDSVKGRAVSYGYGRDMTGASLAMSKRLGLTTRETRMAVNRMARTNGRSRS